MSSMKTTITEEVSLVIQFALAIGARGVRRIILQLLTGSRFPRPQNSTSATSHADLYESEG
jgi:hypothetical protein